MLAKKYRLPVHKIYKTRGRIFGSDFFSVKIIPNNLGFNRFGAVVGVKIAKKATARNKLRRIIFNLIREWRKNFDESGLDVLIIAKPAIGNLPKKEIENRTADILNQIKY